MAKPYQSNAPAPPRTALDSLSPRVCLVQDALLFGLLFWFLWHCVDTRLAYHGGGEIQVFPTFRWGGDYFRELWHYQGGLSRYLTAFLAQSFYDARAGALLLTLQAWLSCVWTRLFLRTLGGRQVRWVSFVLPLLLLALHSGYAYCLGAVTNLLLGLGFACLFARWRASNPWLRLCATGIVAALLYAVAGSALGLFIPLVILFELHQGRWLSALLTVPVAVLVPLAEGRILFGLNWAEAFDGLRPFVWKVDTTLHREMNLVYGLYLFLPLLSLGLLFGRRIPGASGSKAVPMSKGKKAALQPGREAHPKGPALFRSGQFVLILETGCVLLAAAAVQAMALDRQFRAVLAVDYYASQRMWPQVLAAARANPRNVYVTSAVNRALAHTGNLGRDLPLFQSADNLLLLDDDVRAHWNKIDIYLDLGCVNLALHHLAESLALYGERPYLLTRLAVANLALGNTGTARIYLRSLARTPFYGRWATDYLGHIDLDPTLTGDAEVARLRGLMLSRDELVPLPTEQMLSGMLDAHTTNRMAAEYLICYDLLTKDLDALAKDLNRLGSLALDKRPPLYDEAALLTARRKAKSTNLVARLPTSETRKRFERFVELAKASKSKPLTSNEALSREFGASYFLYYYSQP